MLDFLLRHPDIVIRKYLLILLSGVNWLNTSNEKGEKVMYLEHSHRMEVVLGHTNICVPPN